MNESALTNGLSCVQSPCRDSVRMSPFELFNNVPICPWLL